MPPAKTKKILEEANAQLEREVAEQRKMIGELRYCNWHIQQLSIVDRQ